MAISAQELAALLQCSPRRIRAMISHLRAEHQVPVCSVSAHREGEPTGFFFPHNAEDAAGTLSQLQSRRIEIQLAIEGIVAGCTHEFGQMSLFDGAIGHADT